MNKITLISFLSEAENNGYLDWGLTNKTYNINLSISLIYAFPNKRLEYLIKNEKYSELAFYYLEFIIANVLPIIDLDINITVNIERSTAEEIAYYYGCKIHSNYSAWTWEFSRGKIFGKK